MSGFPTMEKDQVKLRTSLVSFKEEDLKDVIEGQDLVSGLLGDLREVVKAAREAQKGGKIKNAYVKVGVVKKSLVFRIKHDKGHWGEDDIVMARVYVEPERIDEIGPSKSNLLGDKGVLSTSAGDPKITETWWNKARKSFEDPALSKALADYERALLPLEGDPSLAHLLEAADALEDVRRAIVALSKRMTVKDDKKVMVAFLSAAGDERAWLESEEDDYNKRLQETEQANLNQVSLLVEHPTKSLNDLQQAINQNKPYAIIARDYARAVPAMESALDATFDHQLKLAAQKAREFRVSEDDLDLNALQLRFNGVMQEVRRIATQLDQAQQWLVMNEPQVEPELDLGGAPNTVKQGALRDAWAGYLEVLEHCKQTTLVLNALIVSAENLGNLAGDPLVAAIGDIIKTLVETRVPAKASIDMARASGSKYTVMKVQAGITSQLDERYFVPMTNRIIGETGNHRRAMGRLRRVLTPHVERVPEEHLKATRELVSNGMRDAG